MRRSRNSFAAILLSLLAVTACQDPEKQEAWAPVDYVDPMIGSVAKTKYYGRTFPGVSVPYSLVKIGPDTYTGGDNGSGYSYEHKTLEGFSFVHMSGIGWFGDFGNLLVTPTNGDFHPNRGAVENPQTGYRSSFSHDTEVARAGYYAVTLDDYGIRAEMTATPHAGILKFTFPDDSTNRIQVDLARRIGGTSLEQHVKVIGDKRIEGWMKYAPNGGGWGNGKTKMVYYTVYFSAEFSKSFSEYGVWSADIPENEPRKVQDIVTEKYQGFIKESKIMTAGREFDGKHLGFYGTFPELNAGEEVMFKAGISFVDLDGARNNLKTEMDHWDFEKVKQDASQAWAKELDVIKIKGATDKQKKMFYTALYNTKIDPRNFSDCDGRYYLKESGVNESTGFNYRTVFSGWDAFRSHIPLLTIIDPHTVDELTHSLIRKAEDGGMGFPKWEIAGCYSNCMLGDPAIPVIYDAFTKGIGSFDLNKVYELSKQTSLGPNTLRNGWEHYNKHGYVGCDTVPERWRGYYKGVSATLENCYADWCISQMAKELGDEKGLKQFTERSMYYKNLYDPEVGYFRGKWKNGEWIPWVNELDFYSGCIESNPLQQMWFIPHDLDGLKSLMGEQRFLTELEGLFDRTPSDFPFNEFYNHANEPVHHISYLFNYTAKPWLTQKWVRVILNNAYAPTPYGIMGNEDVGQMSGWYILSAMGFHPVCAGDQKYMLGSPLFDEIELKLDGDYYTGKTFKVIAHNNSDENVYVQSVKLNGKPLERPYILHQEITNGGILEFEMGDAPNNKLYSIVNN